MLSSPKLRSIAAGLLQAVPVISLLVAALSWLRFGVDLPFLDDYRPYIMKTALSLAPKDLFTPSNDTIYAVGIALDALAQRFLSGNPVPYQFLSMLGLLGGLLWLQWRLLSAVVPDKLAAAAAFALCIFMVQPGTYWGLQSMAYHQGLPTLFLFAALALITAPRWRTATGVPAVFGLGLLAGFSYISGAFGALAAAIALLVLAPAARAHMRGILAGALALLASAVITAVVQAWVIVGHQGGHIHDGRTAWALPTDAAFWFYLLGKIGRALGLPPSHTRPDLAIVLAVVAVAVGLAAVLIGRLFRRQLTAPQDCRGAVVFITLSAVVFTYLLMLAAGRANLRPPEIATPLQVFVFGFNNYFHFFWVTLIFPWIFAMGCLAVRGHSLSKFAMPALAGVVGLALLTAPADHVFAHGEFFSNLRKARMNTEVKCVNEALNRGGEIRCPDLAAEDFTPILLYAQAIGASFAQQYTLRPIALGRDDPPPLFRLSAASPDSYDLVRLAPPTRDPDGFTFQPADDPLIVVKLAPGTLSRCLALEVVAEIKAEQPDVTELFVMKRGHGGFAPPSDATALIPAAEPHTGPRFTSISLTSHSRKGYEDKVRIDPVAGRQPFTIKDLEIRCRAFSDTLS